MHKITIANGHDLITGGKLTLPENAVWVGRAVPRWGMKASGLANPYRVGQYPTDIHMHTMTLADVLYWYRVWLANSAHGGKIYDMEGLRRRLRAAGLTRRQLRCYVLGAFDGADTPEAAAGRCADMLRLGTLPFLMLYQPMEWRNYGSDWRVAQRTWTRPALMLAEARSPSSHE